MKRLWLILPVISLVLAQIPLPKPFAGSQTINHLGYTLSYNETHEQVNRVTYDNESIHITTGRVQTDRLTTIGTQSVLSVSWQEQFVQLPSRKNINQPILLLEPKLPIASVILFPGGTGKVGLKPDGTLRHGGNFLVRSRHLFADHHLRVAVFEVPSHKNNGNGLLSGYRASKEHAKDIETVVDYLKQRGNEPVWLIGTSRGSPSAANGAARLTNKVNGLVLTSSLSVPNNKGTQIFELPLNNITAPTFIASHRADLCHVTPPSDASYIKKKLKNAVATKVVLFDGGDEARGRDCGPWGPHGFLGIEKQVVSEIAEFIKSHQ